jgi:uncharacterized protein (DUF488 family)
MSTTNEQTEVAAVALTVWTIGHSTRTVDEFIQILRSSEIACLLDVRSFPGSRRYPQFNRTELSAALKNAGIEYRHLPSLGGRRKAKADSQNTAWRNESFRAYADHMESEEFKRGVAELLELAQNKRTAIMCAEAVWWRCHRGLIADYLKSEQVEVVHLVDEVRTEAHPYTTAARIVAGKLSYRGLLTE